MQALAAKGLMFDILMLPASSDDALQEQLAAIHAVADSVAAIERPNETNITGNFSWNGRKGYAAAAAYQKALYAAMKGDPQLAGKAVYNLTLGGVGADAYKQLGDLSAFATDGNVHAYYPDGAPPPASTLQCNLGLAAITTPADPAVITETN